MWLFRNLSDLFFFDLFFFYSIFSALFCAHHLFITSYYIISIAACHMFAFIFCEAFLLFSFLFWSFFFFSYKGLKISVYYVRYFFVVSCNFSSKGLYHFHLAFLFWLACLLYPRNVFRVLSEFLFSKTPLNTSNSNACFRCVLSDCKVARLVFSHMYSAVSPRFD